MGNVTKIQSSERQYSNESLPTLNLSSAANELYKNEQIAPIEVSVDSSLRLKVLDQCGMACVFCHNEGTPVSSDNVGREASEFTSAGTSSRVSIYLSTNGADFVSGNVQPDIALQEAVRSIDNLVDIHEVHLTGGEPTLHPRLPEIVRQLTDDGHKVKMTSNGERFYTMAPALKEAGLSKVVFSIFGTTPEDLAAVQGGKFNNLKFAQLKLDALERSIVAAYENGIETSANIVMPSLDHAERIINIIDRFGDFCKIRILNSLDEGIESYEAVYEVLAMMGTKVQKVNMTAGASSMSVDYVLPDHKAVGFKQIRKSYLSEVCNDCVLKDNGCEEGFYGMRMYVDRMNQYRVGVCIQRMDLTRPLDLFMRSNLPEAIRANRSQEYDRIIETTQIERIL
ncbi:MAG: radical SAM protein [Candidatus Microsaccharimonas sossegonensis]|uniref:Radical SAM protein n=1 Tax=Candidatus Microsaccharimonas sossegonensis TaxID=2506948 RepID=A0A4Q0AHX1_9BACT|nr:MAG: radical SAM protein [Candidatus Microsaccharimonas sossegonensis]